MNILQKLSKRERLILYALTGILGLSLLYNFLIEPTYSKWKKLNSDIMLAKIKLQKSLSVINDKEKIEKEYAEYADRLKPRSNDEEELTSILNELETLAKNSNLKIVSMRPKTPKDMGYYNRFIVDIDTESDMSSLMRFIYDVRNSRQLIKIDKLNLNTKSSQQGVIIRSSMTISRIAIR